MLRKLLCFILILAIFLSIPGCNRSNEEINNDKPTYYETHIGQTAGLITPGDAKLNSKGQLVIYDWGQSPPSFITIDSEGNRKDVLDCGTGRKIETLINSCKQISYIDTKILSIIRTEANAFFQGEKSAEDTAKVIQQKVSTYLNE